MYDTRKIAIIDDHVLFRKGLMALINMFPGHTVIMDSSNGKEFTERIREEDLPDIILMDINMPEMDGYATTEWLKEKYPQIKVLALSTMEAETAIIKMIKSGAKGYVLKDADPEELKLAFDEVLSRGYFYNDIVSRKILNAVTQLIDPGNTTGTFVKLTDREITFLKFCCSELTYKEIADKMILSVRTIEGYRDSLCEKLDVKTRVGLAMYAVKNGIAVL